MPSPELTIDSSDGLWRGRFTAMGSPCVVLIEEDDQVRADSLIRLVYDEALRIESKFSRYRDDNIIHRINHAWPESVRVDEETRQLLDYAQLCFELSQGRFDITSGVLRAVWTFDGSDRLPTPESVQALLPRLGWSQVDWSAPYLRLAEGMEIDLGGIGKEYAVDRCAVLLQQAGQSAALVNFGGDIHVVGPRHGNQAWCIGLELPDKVDAAADTLYLQQGGIATSGDSHRYLLRDGVRYSHILDPTTGWPVPGAPRSVTVLAPTCLEAGMMSTFAMLQGTQAEAFLRREGVEYRCLW